MQIKKTMIFILLTSALISCTPQAIVVENTPTVSEPTATLLDTAITSTSAVVPSATSSPTILPSVTPASCAVPLSPVENASVPAAGPFDFTWTPFEGAASYVIAIGPSDWYPTTFPVTSTTLTRYMEIFPSSPSYQWTITALNSSGQEICKAGPYTFVTSADQYATPSFTGDVSASTEDENVTNNVSNDGSSNQEPADVSILIASDSDSECRLSVSYRVKSNYPIQFARLLYSYDGGVTIASVDLQAHSSDPYPAYNYYSATTPALPVTNGTVVEFGAVWTNAGVGGLSLSHTMTSCDQ